MLRQRGQEVDLSLVSSIALRPASSPARLVTNSVVIFIRLPNGPKLIYLNLVLCAEQ
jgi:hypothetical protein